MAPTKSGEYSSSKKTLPKKSERPKRDSGFYPANFLLCLPPLVSIGLVMFTYCYQEQGTEAYYIYFSRTNPEFKKLLSGFGLDIDKRSFYRALEKLSDIGWVSIPNPKEGDRRSVWRYDKRAPLALYTAFGIEPRPCMILPEGPTVEDTEAIDTGPDGYDTYDEFPDDFPDVLREVVPTVIKATVDPQPVKAKPLSMQERLNLRLGVSRHA